MSKPTTMTGPATDATAGRHESSRECLENVAENSSTRPFIFNSEELLKGKKEAWIEHGDQMYRLRLTAAGKLYLTK